MENNTPPSDNFDDVLLPPELEEDFERFLDKFQIDRMRPDEQATFILEFARLAHDRYAQAIELAKQKGEQGVDSYVNFVKKLIAELIESN